MSTFSQIILSASPIVKSNLIHPNHFEDIDVHVFDPLGNHAWYGSQKGIPGAAIDVDDTDGYGPEIFSYLSPVPGTYRVAVDAYLINESPTTASLEISVGGKIVFSGSYLFTESDSNNSNGKPVGANPNAFWDAFTFQVRSYLASSFVFVCIAMSLFTSTQHQHLSTPTLCVSILRLAPSSLPVSEHIRSLSPTSMLSLQPTKGRTKYSSPPSLQMISMTRTLCTKLKKW